MSLALSPQPPHAPDPPGWAALELVFRVLGRVLLVLDEDFRILRASQTLDAMGCPGAAQKAIGRPIHDLLDTHVFGPKEDLRSVLELGGREEGRRAFLHCGEQGSRLVALTVAALPSDLCGFCEPGARCLVVIRPAEEDLLVLQGAMAAQGIVARSKSMIRIVNLVENLYRSEVNVLITGESGSGKEVVARAVHALSPVRDGPFVAVNCAALPGDLLESELFGHVRGAFTGAVKDRVGRFELAAGGTIFLDEIGEMTMHSQVKLLRVLEARRYERVGESTSRELQARIIAATNADLTEAMHAGRFREDLYYRLRVVPIHVPPLRERPEDIEPLAQFLLAKSGARHGAAVRLSRDTLRALEAYAWPGNVRELENALEYAVALCKGQTVQVEDLPIEIRDVTHSAPSMLRQAGSLQAPLPDDEAAVIRRALETHQWSRTRAAQALGMSRTTFWRRMRALGISETPPHPV